MAKCRGVIGYATTSEREPGIWVSDIIEKKFSGDLLKNYADRNPSGINDDINISNNVSIVSNPYAFEHFFEMRYIKFEFPKLGGAWRITGAEVVYPRLTLTIGGVYNGEQAVPPDTSGDATGE